MLLLLPIANYFFFYILVVYFIRLSYFLVCEPLEYFFEQGKMLVSIKVNKAPEQPIRWRKWRRPAPITGHALSAADAAAQYTTAFEVEMRPAEKAAWLWKRLQKPKRRHSPQRHSGGERISVGHIILPERVGSMVGVYNCKTFNQVNIKPETVGHYLGELSITYKPVKHEQQARGSGWGSGHSCLLLQTSSSLLGQQSQTSL